MRRSGLFMALVGLLFGGMALTGCPPAENGNGDDTEENADNGESAENGEDANGEDAANGEDGGE